MLEFARNIQALLGKSEEEQRSHLAAAPLPFPFDRASVHKLGRNAVLTLHSAGEKRLLVVADCGRHLPDGFEGERFPLDDGGALLCGVFSAANAAALRRHFPWCAPKPVPGAGRTAGFELDERARARLEAVRKTGHFPVLSGSPDEAVFGVFSSDFRQGYAVNGGRAATPAEGERLRRLGSTLVVLRPCGASGMEEEYAGKRFVLGSELETFDGDLAARCCAFCGGLAEFAAKLAGGGRRCSFGIALDEGAGPTMPEAHLFAVREMRKRDLDFAILLVRWPEEAAEFAAMLRRHAAIARMFGGYRIAIPLDRIPAGERTTVRRLPAKFVHLEFGEASESDFTEYFRDSGLQESESDAILKTGAFGLTQVPEEETL